jgi:uncharacterized membrane protein YkoI
MRTLSISMVVALVVLAGCASLCPYAEREKSIPLSEVPAAVKDAATAAVEGIVLTEAEVEKEDGQLVYELEGKVGEKEYEIEVSADGKVLEVEEEDD